MFVYDSLRNVTKSKQERELQKISSQRCFSTKATILHEQREIPRPNSSFSLKMMNIPPEFMSRRGSLESRQSTSTTVAATTSIKHTRAQSLKERLLNRKLPKVLRDNLSLSTTLNYDVTMSNHRCGGEGEILSKEDGSVCGRDKEEEDVDTRKTTPTSSSTTITRWSSFREAVVRRNDSRQSSDFRLNSCRQSTDNVRINSCRNQSPQILSIANDEQNASTDRRNSFDGLSTKKVKDQFCGSTPILFSKQKLNGIGGSASPTPHPRSRRARSEAEHRAGSFKTRKGPPPKPPKTPSPPGIETPPALSSPPPLSPPDPFPFPSPSTDNENVSVFRRSSDQRLEDEGVILSPSPASVVKALAPLLAPVFAVAALKNGMTNKGRVAPKLKGTGKSDSDSGFEMDSNIPGVLPQDLPQVAQEDFDKEYDIVQKVGEGWFSRVYLTEHRQTREEIVLKAINRKSVSAEEFLREFHNSYLLSAHKNVLTIYDVVFQVDNYYMFATEYAPLGDLTSNVSDNGIGEVSAKRVAQQIGSALEWVHSKNLCHLDVKLDNILVFDSDFNKVKLCDFGSVRSQGDIVIKKNELLPYCPAELVAKHANEYYQVDRVQDVFQFGIVVFFCLFGILPWQRADTADPNFAEFLAWRRKRTSKVPKNFKPMSSRGQKLFRKLLDPDPTKRLKLAEIPKYTEDKWLRGRSARSLLNLTASSALGAAVSAGHAATGRADLADPTKFLSDGISQLTMGSFQSVHSNAVEKNRILYTLLQHGVETTVDRNQKNSRIINWICHGQGSELPGSGLFESPEIAGPEIDELLKLQLPVDDDDIGPDRSVTD